MRRGRRKHAESCTCQLCGYRREWEANQAKHRQAAEERLAKAERRVHPELRCEIIVFGVGVETWRMDHGLVDERGRKVGGIVDIRALNNSFGVRIHATRDGVTFGALRREEWCISLERAQALAAKKLRRQRDSFQRKYPGMRPTDNQQRS